MRRVHARAGTERAPRRPRRLADQRAGLRRRHGRDDGGDQPEPRGPATRRASRACPRIVIYNPLLAYETGEEFVQALVRRGERAGSTRSSSCSRARCRTRRSTARATGRRSASTRRPASRSRPARGSTGSRRRAAAVMALGTCAAYGGDPRDAQQPDRRDGPARLPRPRLDVAPRDPDRQPARLPGAARQHHRDAARTSCSTWAASAPAIDLDEQGRPRRLFERTVHEGCDRAGFAEQGEFARRTATATAASSSSAAGARS